MINTFKAIFSAGSPNRKLAVLCIILVLGGVAMSLLSNNEPKPDVKATESDYTHIERLLEQIEGVGEVELVITYKNEDAEEKSYFSPSAGNEKKVAQGAVAVVSGGASPQVVYNVSQALSALLDIDLCNIKVYEKAK